MPSLLRGLSCEVCDALCFLLDALRFLYLSRLQASRLQELIQRRYRALMAADVLCYTAYTSGRA